MTVLFSETAWAEKIFDFPIENTSASITCAYQGYAGHNGYDLGAGYGTAIYALFDGTVTYRVRCKLFADGKYHSWDYGNYLDLESSAPISGDNYLMRVAHLSNFDGTQCTVPSQINGVELVCDNGTPRLYDKDTVTIVVGTKAVTKGQLIGYSGSCGYSTGNHLHIEIKKNNSYVNPDDYISRDRFVGDAEPLIPPSITTPKNNATIRKQVNKSFTYTLKAEGSEATWSKKSGSLPTGVRVDSGGTISGTPTQTGQFKFVIQAQNSAGVDTKNVTLDIYGTNEVPKITTTSLTTGKVNENYSFTVKATGRTPITWTASGLPSGLSIDSSTGTISGKTAYSGKFYVQIVAKNKIKSSATKTLWLEIYEKPAITTSSINETAYTFTDYNATFTATGYPAPTWSITVLSQLPPGLTLDSKTGVLSGKPTKTGTYNFKVKATNSVDSATKKFKIVVKVGNPQITTSSLPKGKVGTAYSTQLTGNNLPSGSAWAATSTLPAGMTLSKTGVLSGTPKSAGTYNIYAMAVNKTGVTTTKTFTLTVTDGLKITTESLPDATLGKDYKVTLEGSSATAITWFADGTLPAGFTLSSKGVLSGTPVYSGTYYIYAKAMNAYGAYVSKTFTLKIVDGLAITTTKLSNATVGKSYKATLKAKGATAITWFADGRLPPGLTLSPDGVLSGVPACKGTYYVYARAMNIYGTYVSKTLTLTVGGSDNNSAVRLSDATVDEEYEESFYISFPSGYQGKITRSKSGTLPKGLSISSEGEYITIKGTPKEAGIFRVKITLKDKAGNSVYKWISLTVDSDLKITTKSLPAATVGKSYKTTLKASGASSFVWRAENLPTGLTCSPSGVISGTPLYASDYSVYLYAYSPNGRDVSKGWITLTVNSASNTSTTQDQDNASTKSDNSSDSESETDSGQNESLVKFGTPRDVSSLSSEVLRDFANDGCIIAAVLPEIQVTKDGIYSFTVSIDKGVPMGSKLLWRSMPVNGEDVTDDDGGAVFTNVEGEEISTVPSDYSVNVSSWLRADRVYAPIILARSGSTDASVSSSSAETSEDSGNGGCNGGLASSALLMLVFITRKNRRAKRFC